MFKKRITSNDDTTSATQLINVHHRYYPGFFFFLEICTVDFVSVVVISALYLRLGLAIFLNR